MQCFWQGSILVSFVCTPPFLLIYLARWLLIKPHASTSFCLLNVHFLILYLLVVTILYLASLTIQIFWNQAYYSLWNHKIYWQQLLPFLSVLTPNAKDIMILWWHDIIMISWCHWHEACQCRCGVMVMSRKMISRQTLKICGLPGCLAT